MLECFQEGGEKGGRGHHTFSGVVKRKKMAREFSGFQGEEKDGFTAFIPGRKKPVRCGMEKKKKQSYCKGRGKDGGDGVLEERRRRKGEISMRRYANTKKKSCLDLATLEKKGWGGSFSPWFGEDLLFR